MSEPSDKRRKALGKGLGALLPGRSAAREEAPGSAVTRIATALIEANPLQPRADFDQDRLLELAASIEANGIIQPLVVRRAGTRYQLVAGERRWRAARILQLEEVPVILHEIPDERLLEVTLIENIQREDLNPIEVARAFERLIRDLGLSHEEVGRRTGKNRATITNLLRLLRLPEPVQDLVSSGDLSMGHARALVALPDPELQLTIARDVLERDMSVREVENVVRYILAPPPREPEPEPERKNKPKPPPDPNVASAIERMQSALGTKVRLIEKRPGRGRIQIDYYSPDDLDRIYQLIVGEDEDGRPA